MFVTFSLATALLLNNSLSFPPEKQIAILDIQPETPKTQRLICKDCSPNERHTLAFLQDNGITDRNALATVLGNIKQESTFVPNICEGGARTSYQNCRAGGYGLIQFTSADRYNGLGAHARRTGGDPSTLETQLSYILTEPQWKGIEPHLKTPGRSIDSYMSAAYKWLGWGIHGARTSYAREYSAKLTLEVQS
jgi:hypothetical protein